MRPGAGIYYNLTVVRIPETAAVLPALSQVIGDRRRPFHSSEEGPEAIERMMALIENAGLVGTSLWRSVGRTGQVAARRDLLREHALRCAGDGVDHLVSAPEHYDRLTASGLIAVEYRP